MQDWLYEDGEDASKGVYVAKMDEIRAMAGPVTQRHFEKIEAERRAVQERVDAEQAAKKAAEEEARKAAEAEKAEKAAQEAAANGNGNGNGDAEMKDADSAPQPETEEAGDPK